jgi:hypothetical protein
MVSRIEGTTKLRAFENTALKKTFWRKRGEVTEE